MQAQAREQSASQPSFARRVASFFNRSGNGNGGYQTSSDALRYMERNMSTMAQSSSVTTGNTPNYVPPPAPASAPASPTGNTLVNAPDRQNPSEKASNPGEEHQG
jgi:hypothetical protein